MTDILKRIEGLPAAFYESSNRINKEAEKWMFDAANVIEEQDAEITRLRAIVDKLPKTADGVAIELGQTVWCVLDTGLWSAPVDSIEYGRCWVHKPEVWAGYVEYRDCYSTRAAAEAARTTP